MSREVLKAVDVSAGLAHHRTSQATFRTQLALDSGGAITKRATTTTGSSITSSIRPLGRSE